MGTHSSSISSVRVVGIALTFSVDTSGCERLISLMNDLKTTFQEKMAHETLRDLVWWYKCQHQLKPHEWEAVPKRTLIRRGARRLGDIRVR